MESLHHSTITQLDRIFELLACYLQINQNLPKSRVFSSNQQRFASQNQLIYEMDLLKSNISKMLERSQSLQNQNRVLKRLVTRQNSTYSMYSNKQDFCNENCLLNKYLYKVTCSNYSNGCQVVDSQINFPQKHNSTTSSQFDKIKQEVAGLTENLKSITKAFEKYETDSTKDNEIKDMFLSESSLMRFGSCDKSYHDQSTTKEDNDLENLLCDQELSFDDIPLQEKSSQKISNEFNLVESLIVKGIEFRESRTLRSKQYQTLSSRIQQYRDEIKSKENMTQYHPQSISKYR